MSTQPADSVLEPIQQAIMVGFDLKVAVVRSAKNQHDFDPTKDLTKQLEEAADNDTRYRNASFKTVAWDSADSTDWSQFSHIVLSSGLNYANQIEQFMTWLDNLPNQDRIFNSPSIIKWNISKIYLKELQQKGISIPASVFIQQKEKTTIADVVRQLEAESGRKTDEIIIKNIIDAGGYSVYRVKLDKQPNAQVILDSSVERAQGGVMVQEYLPAISTEGEWSLVCLDRTLSHAVLKKPCQGGFKVQRSHGGSYSAVDLADVPEDIKQLASKVLDAVEEPKKLLYARLDIVRGHNGNPCLMELELFEPDLYLIKPELSNRFLDILRLY